MPKFIKGVFNLRGKIVPLLDLKERFEINGSAAPESLTSATSFLSSESSSSD